MEIVGDERKISSNHEPQKQDRSVANMSCLSKND